MLKSAACSNSAARVISSAASTLTRERVFRWPELVLYCLQDGQTSYLEWEKGDQVSVFVSLEKLSFAQVGIEGKEQLWKISEDEEGSAHYQGRPYSYHEDSAVTFFRDSKEEGTPFHQYQFASDDEETFISVEEWGDEGRRL